MPRTRARRRLDVALLACIGLVAPGLAAGADIADIKAVPYLGEKGRDGYAKFLAGPPTRAFALADNGAFGYSSKRESRAQAVAIALYHCNRAARNICRMYAVNDDVVYPRYAAFERQSQEALARLARESLTYAEYGDEFKDFGVVSPEDFRKGNYHAGTPLSLKGVRSTMTVDLIKMMTSSSPPVLIDALEGEGHNTLPGAYWIRGAGIYAESEEGNGEIRDRLGYVLDGMTRDDKSRPIVFFSLDSWCWLSFNAALRARDLGYTNVHWYRGGLKAWGGARLEMLPALQYGQLR
jgi:PQQ-dependent catabolism-associated CXXCW motif protein